MGEQARPPDANGAEGMLLQQQDLVAEVQQLREDLAAERLLVEELRDQARRLDAACRAARGEAEAASGLWQAGAAREHALVIAFDARVAELRGLLDQLRPAAEPTAGASGGPD